MAPNLDDPATRRFEGWLRLLKLLLTVILLAIAIWNAVVGMGPPPPLP